VSALQASLVVDEDAPMGESWTVAGTLPNTTAANLEVRAPNGIVWWSPLEPGDATFYFQLRVAQEWGFGRGVATLSWVDNATGNWTSTTAGFTVSCPLACELGFFHAELERIAVLLYALTASAMIVAFVFAGHAAHVYAVRSGEPPWNERVSYAFRSRVSRDPMTRSKKDPLNLLPEYLREEFTATSRALETFDASLLVQKRVQRRVTRARLELARAGILGDEVPEGPDGVSTPGVSDEIRSSETARLKEEEHRRWPIGRRK
jgi:hypothetical protein